MNKREILEYYSRNEVLEHLVAVARDREVSVATGRGTYMRRPDMISYPRDVIEFVRRGGVSFHASVERWKNPMAISTGADLNSLRTGWDLVLDIDSSLGLDGAKLAVKRVLNIFANYGVKNVGIKFSGNRGFHLGIPFEAFPTRIDFKPTRVCYPEIPRIIAAWVRSKIERNLLDDLIKLKGSVRELVQDTDIEKLTPFSFVEIEQSWGLRHLFRMPFSLNEKTWLASVPLSLDSLDKFKPANASPDKITVKEKFFRQVEREEATNMLLEAMDWNARKKQEETKPSKKKIRIRRKAPENRFPPCIKKILLGLPDGRKRSIFVLANFLHHVGWGWDEIEQKIMDWNKKNKPPLPTNYVRSQIRWFTRRSSKLLPPNCDNATYYQDFGVCQPDPKCKRVKNPVVYPFKKFISTK